MDIQAISEYLTLGKDSLGLLKEAAALLPRGPKKEAAEKQLLAAEQALARDNATLAKQQGMRLCDCTMPPQVMLWREGEKAHVCPNPQCGRRHVPRPRARVTRSTFVSSW